MLLIAIENFNANHVHRREHYALSEDKDIEKGKNVLEVAGHSSLYITLRAG